MSPVLPCESKVGLSPHSLVSLGVSSVQWAAEKQRFVDRIAADSSIKEYKTAFPSTFRLMTVWTFKYENN